MEGLALFVGIGICVFVVAWGVKQRKRTVLLEKKLQPIIDVEEYVTQKMDSLTNEAERAKKQLQEEIRVLDLEINNNKKAVAETSLEKSEIISRLEEDLNYLKEQGQILDEENKTLENQIKLLSESEAVLLSDLSYYERSYEFDDVGKYSGRLETIRRNRKDLVKMDMREAGAAVYRTADYHSLGEQRQISRLMLRAFNGECDGFIARVNYKNIELMKQRIINTHASINKITYKQFRLKISMKYKDTWVDELCLVYEWEEFKQQQKEEQARIREQIREEERAAKEMEKAKREAEKEARTYAEALEKARSEVDGANEKEKDKLMLQIAELEKRMIEMEEKNRYISQAMLTKTGHVYIISNLGSFGENVYKIGMTRRLEPMERVKELGDASVPFPFDVHAMIRSSNAPALENALHKHFDGRRVNLENNRKEFFYVSIEEIKQELLSLKRDLGIDADLQLTLLAEAEQWRKSRAKRKHLEEMLERS